MELSLSPIGLVHTPFRDRASAPRQPGITGPAAGRIVLADGHGFEDALVDLGTFSHLWVLYWFHLNRGWRPKVAPPRSAVKRGVFATRAPRRPNPLGLSVVRLHAIEGLTLHVSGVDMLDGTPVLDLKPYVPYADHVPGASSGWLEAEAPAGCRADAPPAGAVAWGTLPDPGPRYDVALSALAEAQCAFLRERGLELEAMLRERLALGPTPHAYRRIRRDGDRLRVAVQDWRAWFVVEGRQVLVVRVGTGYRARELATGTAAALALHRAFVGRFGRDGAAREP